MLLVGDETLIYKPPVNLNLNRLGYLECISPATLVFEVETS